MAFAPSFPLNPFTFRPAPLLQARPFFPHLPKCTLNPSQIPPPLTTTSTPSPLPRDPQTNRPQRNFSTFHWRGHSINYLCQGPSSGVPVLFVHGFGASINHWRSNLSGFLQTSHFQTFAIDLLGFGASEKASPSVIEYGIPLWRDLIVDFTREMGNGTSWSLVGNSIGSLTVLAAAVEMGKEEVRAVGLINCSGGLTSFRYSELNWIQAPLLWLFNTALFNKFTGPILFENFRKRDTVQGVLKQVYIDQSAIDDDLLDFLTEPSLDAGACDVFLAVLNGDAGPSPEELLQQLQWCPVLCIWGEKDPWTPLKEGFHPGIDFDKAHPGLELVVVENAGHCVHDECPEKVNALLIPFLKDPKLKKIDQLPPAET